MDVRCERCQTEYELEDSAVGPAGTEVQCTSCGHTFMLAAASALPAAGAADGPPPAADWMLETPDGQVHRFRNLNSLQKWIIERKVTRDDRISKIGHGWRRLGDVVELAPFFDVVDEADRARAAKAGAVDLLAEAAVARQAGLRRTPQAGVPAGQDPPATPPGAKRALTPLVSRKDMSMSGSIPPRPAEAAAPIATTSDVSLLPLPTPGPPTATDLVRVRPRGARGLKVFVGLAAAGVLSYVGVRLWRTSYVQVAAPDPAIAAPAEEAPRTTVTVTPTLPEAMPITAVAAAAGTSPTAAAPRTAPPPSAAGPAADVRTKPAPAPADDPAEYAALVAQADRALENGARTKASKLYDRALALRPSGAEAIAGIGYLMLDRGHPDKAVRHFKKALAQAAYPPAIFGLAEAERARGSREKAFSAYERYLEVAPTGTDAPAARRQLKVLAQKASGGSEDDSPAVAGDK